MHLQLCLQHRAQRHNYCEPGFTFMHPTVCVYYIRCIGHLSSINHATYHTPLAHSHSSPLFPHHPTRAPPYSHTPLFYNYRFHNPPFYKCVPYSVNHPHPPFYNYILFCKSTTCVCTLHPLISKCPPTNFEMFLCCCF